MTTSIGSLAKLLTYILRAFNFILENLLESIIVYGFER